MPYGVRERKKLKPGSRALIQVSPDENKKGKKTSIKRKLVSMN